MPKKTYQEFKKEITETLKTYYDILAKGDKADADDIRTKIECKYIIDNAFGNLINNSMKLVPDEKKYEFFLNATLPEQRHFFNQIIISTITYGEDNHALEYFPDENLRKEVDPKTYEEQMAPLKSEDATENGIVYRLGLAKKEAQKQGKTDEVANLDKQIAEHEKKRAEIKDKQHKIDAVQSDYDKYAPKIIAAIDTIPEDKRQEVKDKIYTGMAKSVTNSLSQSGNGYEAYLNYLDTLEKQGIDFEKCVPEDKEYALPLDHDEDYREKTNDEDIQKLLSATDDPEYKEILNDINDNILYIGTEETLKVSFDMSEPMGLYSERVMRDVALENLEKDPLYKGKVAADQKTMIKVNADPKDSPALYDDLYKGDMVFDDKLKKDILDIAEVINKYCSYKGELQDPEQGTKFYAMEGLYKKKQALQDAVKNGNEAEIKKAYQEYNQTEEEYDRILEIAHEMDNGSSFIGGNVSCARNQFVKAEIRYDIVGVSRLATVWQLWSLSKRTGIPLKNFLDEPSKSLKKSIEMFSSTKNFTTNYLKDTSISKIIKDSNSQEVSAYLSKRDASNSGFIGRTLEGLVAVSGENRTNNATFNQKFITVVQDPMSSISAGLPSSIFSMGKEDVLERLYVIEKKDISAYNICDFISAFNDPKTGEPYMAADPKQYIKDGKTTAERVTYRLTKTIMDLEASKDTDIKGFRKSVTQTVKMLLNTNEIQKNPETVALLNKINDAAKTNKPFKIADMQAYKTFRKINEADNLMKEIDVTSNSKESYMDSLKAMKTYKDQYDHSWFFMKWFSSNTKSLLTISNNIEAGLLNKGVSQEDIHKAVKALSNNNNEKFEKLCEDLQKANRPIIENPEDKIQENIEIGEEDEEIQPMEEENNLNKSFVYDKDSHIKLTDEK